ncbi:MAG TPA: pitrilysin family protein [Kofleriaceae bacterium]|nr:pitrilysin family protein [Kofleriaceae bacterium]
MKPLTSLSLVTCLVAGSVATAAAAPKAPPPPPPRPAPAPPAIMPSPSAPRQLSTVEGITEYVLGNGLRVLLFPDPSKDTFTVNITYVVGSRMEGYGETGMAHLLEHMLFKGSPKHPKIWEELQSRGAANNASTWYDRTNYFETLPAKDDNLAWALDIEADRMINSNIAQTDLDKEFSVVRNEFELGENKPDEILSERMWSTAYLWHNYGKSTIGSRADIEKVPATSLKRFYKKYYRPDNAVLIVAGKFDQAAALKLIGTSFGGIANPPTPLEPTYTVEPVQDGERVVTLRRNGDVQVVGLLYHVPAAASPDFPSVEAIGQILTDEPSGRLYVALVKAGLATSVTSGLLPLHDPSVLELNATVPVGKSVDVVRDKMIAIVEGLAKTKITDEEVARFKAKAKRSFKLTFANSPQLGIRLSEYIAAGDWRLLFLHRDRVAALTAAPIQKSAAAYLVPSNRTLGIFVPAKTPERAPLEGTPDIGKLVTGYKGQPPEPEGEKFDATLDNIEKRTTRATLASGMKLAILAKQTRSHVVRARLTLRFGTEADFTGRRAAISMLDQILPRGTKLHTFQQLKDQWDLLEAQVGFGSQPGQLDVNIQTTRENLPAVLALVDEVLRHPAFPQDQFDIVVKEALTQLDDQKSDPQAQAFAALTRAASPYPKTHPLYTPTTDEEIAELKALKLADLRPFTSMFGTSNATMTIVGDVDAAAIKPWIEKTWGTWKSPRPWKRLERKYTAPQAGELVLDIPDKASALIAAVHAVDMKDDDADAPAMAVANYTLGGGGFVSRLLTRLRQKDGLSYFAFSLFQLVPLDAAGAFLAGGALNPENAKKGMAAMIEEITTFVSGGVTTAELADAKKGFLSGFERNLSNDNAVLGLLNDGLYLNRTMDYWTKRNAAITALTLDQVNAAIKRRFKPGSLVKITAGDKKKM